MNTSSNYGKVFGYKLNQFFHAIQIKDAAVSSTQENVQGKYSCHHIMIRFNLDCKRYISCL